jgi:predicted dinucleotide-binding enzyme
VPVTRNELSNIAILGAGRVGTSIARVAIEAGLGVAIAASGSPADIALIIDVLVPGATAATARDAVATSEVVVLAVPLHKFSTVDPELLAGKIVIDVMNYWEPVDGYQSDFDETDLASSEVVQRELPLSRVVKTLNHIGYHELEQDRRPAGAPDRRALGVAGNDPAAVELVMSVIERFGFDPVNVGTLAQSAVLAPGGAAFGRRRTAEELSTDAAVLAG